MDKFVEYLHRHRHTKSKNKQKEKCHDVTNDVTSEQCYKRKDIAVLHHFYSGRHAGSMSVKLKQCREFFVILLSGNKRQGLALLDTATREQVHCISEIAHNLLSLPLRGAVAKKIEKRQRTLRILSSKKNSYSKKSKTLYKSSKSVLDTLLAVRNEILSLTE